MLSFVLQHSTITLDGPGRGEVLVITREQHPVVALVPSQFEYVFQRPRGQPTSACGRADAIPDVAAELFQVTVELVAQPDGTEVMAVLDDPPVAAGDVAALQRLRFLRQQLSDEGLETGRCGQILVTLEPGPVLVGAFPLGVRVEKGREELGVRDDELGQS